MGLRLRPKFFANLPCRVMEAAAIVQETLCVAESHLGSIALAIFERFVGFPQYSLNGDIPAIRRLNLADRKPENEDNPRPNSGEKRDDNLSLTGNITKKQGTNDNTDDQYDGNDYGHWVRNNNR